MGSIYKAPLPTPRVNKANNTNTDAGASEEKPGIPIETAVLLVGSVVFVFLFLRGFAYSWSVLIALVFFPVLILGRRKFIMSTTALTPRENKAWCKGPVLPLKVAGQDLQQGRAKPARPALFANQN